MNPYKYTRLRSLKSFLLQTSKLQPLLLGRDGLFIIYICSLHIRIKTVQLCVYNVYIIFVMYTIVLHSTYVPYIDAYTVMRSPVELI